MPVTRPNGDLVVPYSFFAPLDPRTRGAVEEDRVAAVVSHDGGATFTQPIRIAALQAADDLNGIRAPSLPSAAVDAAGKVYVAWQDGRFRSRAGVNDIVFSTSPDGMRWTEPARIPMRRHATYILPAIAVDPATSGKKARVAVAYYSSKMSARLLDLRARLLPGDRRVARPVDERRAHVDDAAEAEPAADADRVARGHHARRDARRLHQRLVREGEAPSRCVALAGPPPARATASRFLRAG